MSIRDESINTLMHDYFSGRAFKNGPFSPMIDAFGRSRVSEPFGIFDNKNIASRNRNQWEEIIAGVIITYNTLVGVFTPGEEIRGTLPTRSIPLGIINTDNGTSSMNIDCDHNDFQVGDTITGQTSGATAVIVSTNTGSDIQHQYDRSSVLLTVGAGSADSAVRHTHRYNAYVPGKSQQITCTFVMGNGEVNRRKRVGAFDNLNGIFLEQNGTTDLAVVVRSSTSGSPIDNRITQGNWNLDTLDGSHDKDNPSGVSLDLSKSQILVMDFQWLGVGRVRYGFNIDGQTIYVHEQDHANSLSVVYMKTPTLPVRFEIANTGAVTGQAFLEEICCAVASEGGYALPGYEFSADAGITPRSVTTTLTPVFAIRLKNEFPAGKPNRRTVKFLKTSLFVATNNAHIEVRHVHEPIDITANWIDVGGNSAVEYSTDITAVTGRPHHIIKSEYAAAGAANKGTAEDISGEFINLHGFLSQSTESDNSQMFVVYARSFTATANIYSGFDWIEYD
jgi:hypothetical protein